MSLVIRKKGNKDFWHYWNTFKYSANDTIIIFDNDDGIVGDTVKLRNINGRVVFQQNGFLYSDVTIYDDSTGGSAETFPNIESLKSRLINLGYPFNGGSDEFSLTTVEFANVTGDPTTNANLVAYVDGLITPIETELGDKLDSVVAGDNVTIDNTDPNNPIINVADMSNLNGGTP